MSLFSVLHVLENEPRETWKEKVSKMIISEDKANHRCLAYYSDDNNEDTDFLNFDLENLDNFVSPLKANSIVRDTVDGREYYVPFLVSLDPNSGSYADSMIYKGNRTELVYLYEGSTAPLVYEMVYIPQNSKRFVEITEEEIDPEFRKQLHRWWNGEFSIIGDDEGRILD